MPTTLSPKRSLLIHWVPAMLGVALIMAESTDVMNADNTSRWLYPLWSAIFGSMSMERWGEIHHILRKTGHFMGYGLVSLGFHHSWRLTLDHRWRRGLWSVRRRAALLALACTLLLASADEIHQRFLPDRTSSIYDVGIDISGGMTAQLLLFAGLAFLARPRPPRIPEGMSVP